MTSNSLLKRLDYYVPNVRCELEYNKDYELLIATVLSAQCTDKRVNMVTKVLFDKYDIFTLAKANNKDLEEIIRPCGSFHKKSEYIIKIAEKLVNDYDGHVPNNFTYLETLPGVGHKTCNVVLKELYHVPCIPVDTHVIRVSKRLGLANEEDSPEIIERKLNEFIPKDKWNRVGDQILLFGRYHCLAKNPKCDGCLFKNECKKISD